MLGELCRGATEPDRLVRLYGPVPFVWAILSLAAVVIGTGLLARYPAVRPPRRGPILSLPLCIVAAIAAAGCVATGALSFEFLNDDFGSLLKALKEPWAFDAQLRLVGVQLPFWLAVETGAPALTLGLLDVAAASVCAFALAAVLIDAGWTGSASFLASMLFLSSEPVARLIIWGSGAQQLLAWGFTFAIVYAVTQVVREGPNQRGRAWCLLALGFGGLAGLCKWQVAWIAVPASWIWAGQFAGTRGARARRVLVPSAVAVMILAPLLAESLSAGLGTGHPSLGRLGPNLSEASRRLAGLIAAVIVGIYCGSAIAVGSLRVAVTRTREAIAHRGRRIARALILAGVSTVPFLFAERYFAEYYVGLASAWIAAAAAPLLIDTLPHIGARAWTAAALVLLLWVPVNTLDQISSSRSPGSRIAVWLLEVRAALAEAPRANAIVIDANCGGEPATHASRAELEDLFRFSEQGDGVRWVTGCLSTPVRLGPATEPGQVVLEYCAAAEPHVRLVGR